MAATLPSPPVSASSPAMSLGGAANSSSELPVARHHPLRPGSQKEISLVSYLDDKVVRIQRRYGKKFSNSAKDADDTPGYVSFEEVIQDVDPLINLTWVTGTPSLQIPYLLSLAGLLVSYMPAFPFSTSTFSVLKKLDRAFVTLLRTRPPAFHETDTSVASRTEKVRIKSLAEDTRVVVVNSASGNGFAAPIDDFSSDEYDDDDTGLDDADDDDIGHDGISVGLGRVYKKTLEILGDDLA